MNLFETLLHPDREELEFKERSVVCSAANILQVGEFQFLQLAYREWHNRDLPEALVDQLFSSYMLKNAVPHWARHYARLILEKDKMGQVDDQDPAYHDYDADYHSSVPDGTRRFWMATLGLVFTLGGAILIASLTTIKSTTILPPYFNEEELKPTPRNFSWGRSDSIPADFQRRNIGPGS